MPGPVLSVYLLNLTKTLGGRHYYYDHFAEGHWDPKRLCHLPQVTQPESDSNDLYPHFTDEETKSQAHQHAQ